MTPTIRKTFAILAALGATAGIVLYMASFGGATMDSIFPLSIGLHIYMMGLIALIVFAERDSNLQRRVWFREVTRAWPTWAALSYKVLAVVWIIQLIYFFIQTQGGAPEVKDGIYVLNNHGHVIRELAESEYQHLKEAELRLFAVFWATGLTTITFYWWFPRVSTMQQSSY